MLGNWLSYASAHLQYYRRDTEIQNYSNNYGGQREGVPGEINGQPELPILAIEGLGAALVIAVWTGYEMPVPANLRAALVGFGFQFHHRIATHGAGIGLAESDELPLPTS